MAHQIEGTIAVYDSIDGPAWHNIGTEIQCGNGFDADVIAAKAVQPLLLSSYTKSPLLVNVHGKMKEHPTQSAIVRVDDGKLCGGVVGSSTFNVPQPRDLFMLARQIAKDIPGIKLSFAAMLAEGSRLLQTWNLGDFEIAGELYQRHLIIHAGFDGSYSREVMMAATRAVCNNTVSVSRYEAKNAGDEDAQAYHKIRNTKNAHVREAVAVDHCRSIFEEFGKVKARAEKLAEYKIDDLGAVDLIDKIMKKRGKDIRKSKPAKNEATAIMNLYLGSGIELEKWRGTAYGLEQAVAEYDCHHVNIRGVRKGGSMSRDQSAQLKAISHVYFDGGASRRAACTNVMNDLLNTPKIQTTVPTDMSLN